MDFAFLLECFKAFRLCSLRRENKFPFFVQQTLDVGEGFAGLLFNSGGHVVADLPRQIDGAAVNDNLAHAFIGELALD